MSWRGAALVAGGADRAQAPAEPGCVPGPAGRSPGLGALGTRFRALWALLSCPSPHLWLAFASCSALITSCLCGHASC